MSAASRRGTTEGPDAVLAARLSAQLLAGPPAESVTPVVEHLLAVQAQDVRGVRLAIRARTRGLHVADVDAALTDSRSVVVSWLNRGTLHLVTVEDYWWLQQLTTPPLFTGNARRLVQEGVSPEQAETGVALVSRALADGPATRGQLRERLDAGGVPTAGQALVHVLVLSTLRGLTVRGPVVGGEQAFVLVDDWLGPAPEPLDRDVALAELARRYLRGHGPASERDLSRWAGLPLRDARRGLRLIAGALVERPGGMVDLADRSPVHPLPPPRLLGAFDPLLLGWASREFVLGQHQGVVTSNGLFRPVALAGGRAVATWRLPDGTVQVAPFDPLPPEVASALAADAEDVTRFLR